MNWPTLLLNCTGRIKRRTYLIGLLPVVALAAAVYLYIRFAMSGLPFAANLFVIGLGSLAALYLLACLSVKRLSDIGRPAWFLAFFYSPLVIAAVFLFQQKYIPLSDHQVSVPLYTLFITLALIGFFWILVEMLFRRTVEPGADAR